MRWVRDTTGRFPQRPHFEERELDEQCEAVIADFLTERYGLTRYPITTDDLVRLVERAAADVDLYADLSEEGDGVEGVTDFFLNEKPKVRIAAELTNDPRRENRLRTTLTHEFGHVTFHTFLCSSPTGTLPLFESATPVFSRSCHRDTMLTMGTSDWMEWQAGYACGAFVMPRTALRHLVAEQLDAAGLYSPLSSRTPAAFALMAAVQEGFQVSPDAARVRLLKLGYLTDGRPTRPLFDPKADTSR